MRRLPVVLAVWTIISCGGGGSSSPPSQPTTPTQPTPPVTPVNTWSVTGTLVDTAGRQPIGGATVAPSWDLASVQTANDGRYELGAVAIPPNRPYKLTVSGGDLITRELWLTWQQGPRVDVTLDAIRNRAPFDMTFYRQMVRGTYDQEKAPYPVLRWTTAPRFYVRTVDQANRAIEPEVLAVVREALGRGVSEYTAGRYSAAAIESGTETRPEAPGWIRVHIERTNERTTCGTAQVGANPGIITLYDDVCSCGSNKIPGSVVVHEVGHAMGFFHVPDRNATMYPYAPGSCPSGVLTAAEKFHAAIAYSRPRGNVDPDNDPSGGAFFNPPQPILVRH